MSKKLFVVTGPSGAGIGDMLSAVFAERRDVGTVTPLTARKRKEGERDGVVFHFYDLESWNALKEAGGLLETTEFAGNDYGTSRRLVEEQLAAGRHVLLNLSVERAAQVKRSMPEAVCVYVEPSPAMLRERYSRIARSEFEVSVRMETAERQRALAGFCDHFLNSDDIGAAAAALETLLDR